MASKFELEVETDHQSLKWIKKAKSPRVAGWVVKYLWPVPFTMHWLPGSKLVLSDGLSRVPVLPPTEAVDLAAVSAIRLLCQHLPIGPTTSFKCLWFQSTDARGVKDVLRERFTSTKFLTGPCTPRMILSSEWDGAILTPAAEDSPVILRRMLAVDRPFAVLIPLDLLHVAVLNVEPAIVAKFRLCRHLVMPRDCLTWIIFKFGVVNDVVSSKQLFSSELFAITEEKFVLAESFIGPVDMDQLAKTQEEQLSALEEGVRSQLVKRHRFYTMNKRVWIPDSLVEKVVYSYHLYHNHARMFRLFPLFSERFIVLSASGDDVTKATLSRLLDQCHRCAVIRARKQLNVGTFSSKVWSQP